MSMNKVKVNVSELPVVPAIEKGYNRQWCRCSECGMFQYYDYVPYSLSNPITISACGHDFQNYVKPIEIIQWSTKEQNLHDAIKEFRSSAMTSEDYLHLFYTLQSCVSQGSGLVWSQVQEVLDEALKENP